MHRNRQTYIEQNQLLNECITLDIPSVISVCVLVDLSFISLKWTETGYSYTCTHTCTRVRTHSCAHAKREHASINDYIVCKSVGGGSGRGVKVWDRQLLVCQNTRKHNNYEHPGWLICGILLFKYQQVDVQYVSLHATRTWSSSKMDADWKVVYMYTLQATQMLNVRMWRSVKERRQQCVCVCVLKKERELCVCVC